MPVKQQHRLGRTDRRWNRRAVCRGLTLMILTIVALSGITDEGLADASTPAAPKRLAVSPAIGGLTTIVHFRYVALGANEGGYDADEVTVNGPGGTRCAGPVVTSGNVLGPNADQSGPVTVYIGPRAEEEYPAMSSFTAYSLYVGDSGRPLARWCPGSYTGEVTYSDLPVRATFSFRISATKRVAPGPSPAVAHHLAAVTVSPGRGARGTIFSVRYRADAAPYESGDVVELDGPSRSACRGGLVRQLATRDDARSGPLTLHIGPGAERNHGWASQGTAASPAEDNGTGVALRRWCVGTYHGTILYENYAKFKVIARFKLHVAP
jgi:hypothetical protein